MRCSNCDFENSVYSTICLQCGASLEANSSSQETPHADLQPSASSSNYTDPSIYQTYQAQYRAPSPPPTNGHNRLFSPPPPPENDTDETNEEIYGRQSQIFGDFKVHDRQARWTVSRVIRSIIYFIAVLFTGFWLLGAFIEIDQNGVLPYLAFAAWFALIIGSIIVFVRLRQRKQHLTFSQFLFRLMAATLIGIAAIVVETALIPNLSANALASFMLAMILMLYCLVAAVFALW